MDKPESKYARKLRLRRAANAYREMQPQYLIDECVAQDIVKKLRASGFSLVHWRAARLKSAPDEEVFRYAVQNGLIILTHDSGFTNPRRFDLTATHGTLISPEQNPNCERAIQHFIEHMPRDRSYWAGRTVKYTKNGDIVSFTPQTPDDLRMMAGNYKKYAVVIGRYFEEERLPSHDPSPALPMGKEIKPSGDECGLT